MMTSTTITYFIRGNLASLGAKAYPSPTKPIWELWQQRVWLRDGEGGV